MTAILPIWKAEVGKVAVLGQPKVKKKVCETPISTGKSWVGWSAPVIPAMAGSINRRIAVQTSLGKKKKTLDGLWSLMPIILATQEAETRRIMVRSQPRHIVQEPLS
jgi:hypothetical protein